MNTIYLVTGAAGFLGSHVCKQLLRRGEKVRAFVLKNDPAEKYIPGGVEIFEGDLCKAETLEDFFTVPEGCCSIVLHIASMVTVNPDFSQKLVDVNVGGTKNIIEKCLEHSECKKLVYVSSTGAIPEPPKGELIKEIDNFDPDKVVGWYSRTKAMASQNVLRAVRERGLNACLVLPTGIMGPEDHAISETTGTIIKILNGDMPIGMDGSFNLVDVRDLAAGVIAAADKGMKGESYILGNEEITLREICDMMHDECGCKKIRFYMPLWLASIVAKSMEKKAERTGEKPLMTSFSVYNLKRNNSFDSSKAIKELGYKTRPRRETIHDEIMWLSAHGLAHNAMAKATA